jgi:hypothetical protein
MTTNQVLEKLNCLAPPNRTSRLHPFQKSGYRLFPHPVSMTKGIRKRHRGKLTTLSPSRKFLRLLLPGASTCVFVILANTDMHILAFRSVVTVEKALLRRITSPRLWPQYNIGIFHFSQANQASASGECWEETRNRKWSYEPTTKAEESVLLLTRSLGDFRPRKRLCEPQLDPNASAPSFSGSHEDI